MDYRPTSKEGAAVESLSFQFSNDYLTIQSFEMDRYDSFGNLIKERKEMRDFKLVTPDLIKAEFDWKMAAYVIMDHPLSNAVIAVIGENGDIKAPTKQAWSFMS